MKKFFLLILSLVFASFLFVTATQAQTAPPAISFLAQIGEVLNRLVLVLQDTSEVLEDVQKTETELTPPPALIPQLASPLPTAIQPVPSSQIFPITPSPAPQIQQPTQTSVTVITSTPAPTQETLSGIQAVIDQIKAMILSLEAQVRQGVDTLNAPSVSVLPLAGTYAVPAPVRINNVNLLATPSLATAQTPPEPLLVVGAKWFGINNDQGKVYAYSARNGNLIHSWLGQMSGDLFGYSVAAVGDINRDGYDDVLAGTSNGTAVGRAYLFSGRDGSTIYTWQGTCAIGCFFGSPLAEAGDVDGDGWIDLIVTERGYSSGPLLAVGRIYIFSGRTGNLIRFYTGELNYDYFGNAVANAGDVNNDGYPDLIVGAPFWDGFGAWTGTQGKVYVYSGFNGQLLYSWIGEHFNSWFGFSVSGAGDVDNDGYDDVIIGAVQEWLPGTTTQAGKAYVYSGRTGNLIYSWNAEQTAESYGFSVTGFGDVNGDAYDDVVVGSIRYSLVRLPTNPPTVHDRGKVYVYSGADGQLLHSWVGLSYKDYLGWSLSGAGDVDGDLKPDLIVGAPDELVSPGRVYVYGGGSWSQIYLLNDPSAGTGPLHFGTSVSGKWQ